MIRVVKKGHNFRMPTYEPEEDGNVFNWILLKAETVRRLRRIQRDAAEKAAKESEGLG
jgi:hypothetical protein